jgi:hypothetical protein
MLGCASHAASTSDAHRIAVSCFCTLRCLKFVCETFSTVRFGIWWLLLGIDAACQLGAWSRGWSLFACAARFYSRELRLGYASCS